MMSEEFPLSLIIVGAGIFGLSTALAVARRSPATKVTLIDRLTPPVEDGTSVDTTRSTPNSTCARVPAPQTTVVDYHYHECVGKPLPMSQDL